ncbi:MAG: tRNA (N6-isopentenyl adenosine(37)-C2)-methylthiotransferase MiaB [Roseiarcus sp.]|jgi:tRNA-2-methylthio-N6-dimethylallyladenosine synthase
MKNDRPTDDAKPTRRVFIKSFGCQMNVYDSQRMADVAAAEGYQEAASVEDADLIVLNTCHIRERASEKIYSELGKIRELKDERANEGRETTVVVAGCVAQAEGGEILRRQPAVDIVVGPQNYHRLPQLLSARRRGAGTVDTEFPLEDKFDHLPASAPEAIRARGASAFVAVQEGCDKFCSFCVVPYTRGGEASRPVAKVLAEIERLARAGVGEITLLGQNVNAYHGRGEGGRSANLADLIAAAAEIPGVLRLRYATSHPNDMGEDLIRAHREIDALAPYLHLPIQSGSDRILSAMNRRHTSRDYLDLVARVRRARPDIALSSDFIVGFPGESAADFEQTLAVAREVQFASSYAFKYSARPGTPAAEIDDQIDEATKAERLATLFVLLEEQRLAFNRRLVGRRLDVVFDKPGRRPGQIIGRSPYMQSVYAEGDLSLIGAMASVEIVGVGPNSLIGRLVARASREMSLIA